MKGKGKIIGLIIAILLIVGAIIFILSGNKKAEQFKVIFMDTDSEISSKLVDENTYLTKPSDPTKEGYTFKGWYLGSEEFDFTNSKVTKDITLTAKWEETTDPIVNDEKYTIIFDTNGGSIVDSETVLKDATATKPSDPTKEGYKFVSWQLDGKDYDFTTKVIKNITLVAKWSKDDTSSPVVNPTTSKYTVTFNSNGGSKVTSKTVESGKTITKPSNPTKSGYTFVSWQLGGKDYNFSTKVTKNITLIAKWDKIPEIDKYTYSVSDFSDTDPNRNDIQRIVTVKRNGVDITAQVSYIADANGTLLGAKSNGSILVMKSDVSRISKIKYNGQFYTLSK